MKIKRDGTIKKWLKPREDMFLRRLMGMLAKMAKVDGEGDEPLQNCPQWR